MNTRDKGKVYEEHARLYLLSKGYEIECLNYYTKFGEIDIVAKKGITIVFVEVKFRTRGTGGRPYEAVGQRKRQRLMKSAVLYVQENRLFQHCFRFDIIDILGDEVNHYESAFEMDKRYCNI